MAVKADKTKELEHKVKRLNYKLQRAKFALKNNRKMASFMATDLNCMEECGQWIQCIAKNEEDIATLNKQIGELKEVLLKENSLVICAKASVKDIKKKIVHAKDRATSIRKPMEMYGQSIRWPEFITPSCIIDEVMDSTDKDDFIQKCALWDKGFPSCDIFMASCDC